MKRYGKAEMKIKVQRKASFREKVDLWAYHVTMEN